MPEIQSPIAPIMLLEDDANDAFFVQHALKAALIQNPVRVLDSAEQAFVQLGSSILLEPALVILDVRLAGSQTGLDVLSWIRQQPEPMGSTPAIILTGSDRPEDREASERLGALVFLEKPVTEHNLIGAVQALGFDVVNHIASGRLAIHIRRPGTS